MSMTVYFIRPVGQDGPIKIGCTRWLGERLGALTSWSPIRLEVVAHGRGSFAIERHLHRVFANCRQHKEWFSPSPGLIAGIDRVRAGQTIEDAFGIEVWETPSGVVKTKSKVPA